MITSNTPLEQGETSTTILLDLLVSLPEDTGSNISQFFKDSGIDLYKYKKGKCQPHFDRVINAFTIMDRNAGWAILISEEVVAGKLTKDQARDILKYWNSLSTYADARKDVTVEWLAEKAAEIKKST